MGGGGLQRVGLGALGRAHDKDHCAGEAEMGGWGRGGGGGRGV